MKNLSQLSGSVLKLIKANSPSIFSVAAGVGTIATAFLVGKASYRAANIIRDHEEKNPPSVNPRERLKERTSLVWRLYIPPAISTTATIVCVVGANRISYTKTVAAQAALAVAEKAYSEYRETAVEELGARKDQAIRDKVIAKKVEGNPPPKDLVMIGTNDVLCCELFTMRYFSCDVEKLRRAQNDINAELLKHDYATFEDLYFLIGLRPTSVSAHLGWSAEKQLELIFSSALVENDRPCLTFEYNYYKTL